MTSTISDASTPRPLSERDKIILREPVALGQRILGAVQRYSETYEPKRLPGLDLVTTTPTFEILHAIGDLTEKDMRLVRLYRATLRPLAVNSPREATILTLQTARGILSFDKSGAVAIARN